VEGFVVINYSQRRGAQGFFEGVFARFGRDVRVEPVNGSVQAGL